MVFFSIAAPFRLPNVSFAELRSLLCGPCAGALTVLHFPVHSFGSVSFSIELLSDFIGRFL